MLRWPDAVAWLHIPRTQSLRIFHSWCPFYLPEGDGCGSRHSPLPGRRSRQAVTSPACVRARPSAQPPQQSARRINCLNATTLSWLLTDDEAVGRKTSNMHLASHQLAHTVTSKKRNWKIEDQTERPENAVLCFQRLYFTSRTAATYN